MPLSDNIQTLAGKNTVFISIVSVLVYKYRSRGHHKLFGQGAFSKISSPVSLETHGKRTLSVSYKIINHVVHFSILPWKLYLVLSISSKDFFSLFVYKSLQIKVDQKWCTLFWASVSGFYSFHQKPAIYWQSIHIMWMQLPQTELKLTFSMSLKVHI